MPALNVPLAVRPSLPPKQYEQYGTVTFFDAKEKKHRGQEETPVDRRCPEPIQDSETVPDTWRSPHLIIGSYLTPQCQTGSSCCLPLSNPFLFP